MNELEKLEELIEKTEIRLAKLKSQKLKYSKPRVLIGHRTEEGRTVSTWCKEDGGTFNLEIRFGAISNKGFNNFDSKELISDIQCYLDNFY